jgi:molybdopterin-guanine dinucleotide biosynthesis protein A
MSLPFGVILAGGQARRMGGADKALLRLGGLSLAAHVRARMAPQCAALALSANGDPARLADLGLPVLPDRLPDGVDPHPGPLAGVLAGMDWAAAEGASALVTVPADTPFLPGDLVARLQAAAGPGGAAIAASPDAEGRLRRHPVVALWPVALRADLRAALAGGMRKVGLWADRHAPGVAAFALPDPFFNINTPQDLDLAGLRAGAGAE